MFDPSPAAVPTAERIEWARRTEAAALQFSKEIDNSSGASFSAGEDTVVLANSRGFVGSYRSRTSRFSVVPVAQRDGEMQRDYWYSAGRGMADLLPPEEVGRIAGERTVRRLGSRQVPTCEAPIVFDPETAAEILGHLFRAVSGYSVFRNATFLKDRAGEQVASPLLTHGGRGPPAARARARGRSTARGCPRGATCRSRSGVLQDVPVRLVRGPQDRRHSRPAWRGAASAGGPGVGASNLYFEAGERTAEEIVGEVDRGLLRDRPHRLRRRPRVRRLLAGRRRPLDREGPLRPSRCTR